MSGSNVGTIAALNAAIVAADGLAASAGTYTITLTSDISLNGTALEAINLKTGVTLNIVGTNGSASYALIGGGPTASDRGLFVYAGNVSIQDLLIENMRAVGGAGGAAAGGGAGLGGGLFIGSNVAGDAGHVTLSNVSFSGDTATGGAGGGNRRGDEYGSSGGGGGGGLGGTGGSPPAAGPSTRDGKVGSGGGGIGVGASGTNFYEPAGKGIVPGAAQGGRGAESIGSGGGASGGGGGGNFTNTSSGGGGGGVGGAAGFVDGGNGGYGGGGGGGSGQSNGNGGAGGFGGGAGASGSTTNRVSQGGFGGGGGANTGLGGFGAGNGAASYAAGGGGGLAAGGDIFVQAGASLTIIAGQHHQHRQRRGHRRCRGAWRTGRPGLRRRHLPARRQHADAEQQRRRRHDRGRHRGRQRRCRGRQLCRGQRLHRRQRPASSSSGPAPSFCRVPTAIPAGTIINGGILEIASTGGAGSGTITFGASNAVLRIDKAGATGVGLANTLSNFGAGNTLDLAGLTFVSGATATVSGSTLTVHSGSITETFSLSNYALSASLVVQDDGTGHTAVVACFAQGTPIATERGEVPVEHLVAGDRVITAGFGAQDMLWLGSRHFDLTRHPDRYAVMPVRVLAGAFGYGQPARDLLLSPDHAVFVDDVLIPVRALIDGGAVAQIAVDEVTYYHVLLGRHAVILAAGMPCESLLEVDGDVTFDNGFDAPASLAFLRPCAPRVTQGPIVEGVRARLREFVVETV